MTIFKSVFSNWLILRINQLHVLKNASIFSYLYVFELSYKSFVETVWHDQEDLKKR